eukprot:2402553-Amphidinium_carterae.1
MLFVCPDTPTRPEVFVKPSSTLEQVGQTVAAQLKVANGLSLQSCARAFFASQLPSQSHDNPDIAVEDTTS